LTIRNNVCIIEIAHEVASLLYHDTNDMSTVFREKAGGKCDGNENDLA